MATENPVFQILVTSGNQALKAAGNNLSSLAVGQLGVFNYHTGLSVDGSVPGDANDVFLAVGTGSGGVLANINRSAGQVIQKRYMKALTVKGYTGSLPKIVELAGFRAKCETDYSLRIELRNQQAYGVYGFNGLRNTYNYTTGCCNDANCETCPTGDPLELAVGLMKAVNSDPNKLVTATLFTNRILATVTAGAGANGNVTVAVGTESFVVPVLSGDSATVVAAKIAAFINSVTTSGYKASSTGTALTIYPKASKTANTATVSLTSAGGTGVTLGSISFGNVDITDSAAFGAANPGVGASIRFTTAIGTNTPFAGNIPIKYYNAKETDMIISLTDSFECNGTVTDIQDMQFEDGNGINLKLDEYFAGGWNGKPGPYRTSAITGLEAGGYDSNINTNANYNQVVMEYDQFSVGGWLEYLNNLRTIIAIPCADTATLVSLFTIFDLIYTQFQPMTNDVAAMDCTNVNVNTINNYALDGIESLT